GHSFHFLQTSHKADKEGPLAGVPYDGADPKYQDLYHKPEGPNDKNWYPVDPEWAQEWFVRIKDLVDLYKPDLLFTDGGLPFGEVGRSLVAHLYNVNMKAHDGKLEAVYLCKDHRKPGFGEFVEGTAVQDMERGLMHGINPNPWQTDTSLGDWFYNKDW